MKFGIRKPSIKKTIKARTVGKFKRQVKKAFIPMYGRKGMGMARNPKKTLYNKVYNKTSFAGIDSLSEATTNIQSKLRQRTTSKRNEYICSFDELEVIRSSQVYYDNLMKIEEQYSVLFNSKVTEGSEVEQFIKLCKKNIREFNKYKEVCKSCGNEIPSNVPAYKRLIMIYEKQGNYEKAVEVCANAISNEVYSDGTKGGMRGRFERLLKKCGDNVTEEMLDLLK